MSPSTIARALWPWSRLAISLGAAWLVVSHIDWQMLLSLFANTGFAAIGWASLVLTVQFAVMTRRWQLVIELTSNVYVPNGLLAIALGRSMLIGQPLPSTVGGDVVRAIAISGRTGLALAARSVICDRLLALALLVLLVVGLLPLFAKFIDHGAAFYVVAGVSLTGLIGFLVLFTDPPWLKALPWIGNQAAIVARDFRRSFTQGVSSAIALLLGLATHLLGVVLIYALARVVATPISLLDCLLIVPATLLISAIPISFGGWGVREGALAAGFGIAGLSSEAGVATSVLFGLTGPLIGLIAELASPLVHAAAAQRKDDA